MLQKVPEENPNQKRLTANIKTQGLISDQQNLKREIHTWMHIHRCTCVMGWFRALCISDVNFCVQRSACSPTLALS